jgi:hypothetical protein
MSAISMFYGIIAYMHYLDSKKHNLPHIHAKYQDNEVVLTIPEGEILEGSIPNNKMKLLLAWIEIHRDELMANWDLASKGEQVFKIDGLK